MQDNVCLFGVAKTKGVLWEITHRCNFGCLHCCNNSSLELKDKELSLEEVKKGLKNLYDYGIKSIYFSGGDPFVREDFIDILKYAVKYFEPKDIFVATNGKKITIEIARELKKLGIENVLVSLDGYTKESAAKFRGIADSYNIAVNAIKTLGKSGIKAKVGTIIWKETIDHIEDFVKLAIKLKASIIFFSWIIPLGRAKTNKEIQVNLDLYSEVGEELKQLREAYKGKIRVGFRRFDKIGDDSLDCQAGKSCFLVLPSGKISVCSWINKEDKNSISTLKINECDFKKIIQEKSIKNFRNLVKERRKKNLGPGCPAMCKVYQGSYYKNDPLYKKNG